MTCPLCGGEVLSLTGPYEVYQPNVKGEGKGGTVQVCGRCYILVDIDTNIKKLVGELEKWLTSTT